MMINKEKELIGVVPIIPTPFTLDEQIDENALERLVDFAVAGGVQAACLPAYASEFYKLTDEEKQKIESLVNKKIKQDLTVKYEEMSLEKAKKLGAQGVFEDKYKGKVRVYSICSFSKEVCAGPHVANIGELKNFKIIKEERSASGVRRIKANLE